jgi:CRISPR-associated endonuclease Csn1
VASKIQAVVVSYKIDTSTLGRLHNDTAYGEVRDAGDGEPNVVHRIPVSGFTGWKGSEVAEAVPDPILRSQIESALQASDKAAQTAGLGNLQHPAVRRVRRVRVRERLESTEGIGNRADGRPYKRVKLDTNHRAEVWKLPPQSGKPGKARIEVVPMLRASRGPSKPHPAAKLLMRLHKNDCVALGEGGGRRIMRVVKFSSGVVVLADVNEGGALQARNADKSDPFRYFNASVSRLETERARKVRIDPSGKLFDPGPRPW